MSVLRSAAVPLLVTALAACASSPRPQGPRPLTPETGPRTSVRVGYTGGLFNRSVTAHFRTEQNAYVLVAHLGGDGVIRVLYPATPFSNGWVAARRNYRTDSFEAPYDGVPSLFSYTMSPHRSSSAMHDSYDGRGHGYVFIIASRHPLRYDLLEDGTGNWSDWEIADYVRSYDPRYAVRDFAEAVAGRASYTLRYAGSFTTTQYNLASARAWDCTMLSTLGSFSSSYWWNAFGAWGTPLAALRFSPSSYCGGYYYDAYAYRRYAFLNRSGPPVGTPTIIPSTPPEPGDPAPTLRRPGRRGLGPEAPIPTRTTITRVAPGGTGGELASRSAGRSRPTYGAGSRPTYGESARERPRDAGASSSPRDGGSARTASGSSGSSGSSSASGRSSGSTSSGSARGGSDSRGVTSPREARSGKPD